VSAGPRPLWRDAAVVLGVVVLLALPGLIIGPNITADDWVWVRNGEFLGWWDAGGSRQVGRPGAFVLYALVFGLGGPHPLVHALVQVALWAGASVAVLAALREVLQHRTALLVTLVWLVLPGHTTLELWASTSQAWVAVALLAVGVTQVARWARGEAALWPALLVLGSAGAFYEVALLAVPVAVALVDRSVTGAWRWRPAGLAALACLPAATWSVASATVYGDAIDTTERYWPEHLAGPLSLGLASLDRGIALVVLALAVIAVLPLVRDLVPTAREDRALLVSGAALVVAGTIPALRSYTVPFGMGNRLTAISGIGGALFWVGVLRPYLARLGPLVPKVGLAVVLLAGLAVRVDHVVEWNDVGDRAAATAARLAAELSASDDRVLVEPGELAVGQLFYGLYDGWNATAAAQVAADDPHVVVQVDVGCLRSGPVADDPLEQYGERSEQRVPGCSR
jgi:hypothetical protein